MIFNNKKRIIIKDEILGVLEFHEDKKNPDDSYWECRRSIAFHIKNSGNGISSKQRDQVNFIENGFAEIIPVIQEYINQNSEKAYKINREIELNWIEIDNNNDQRLSWEIDFKFKNRWEHLVIEMNDSKPIHLSFWA